MTIFTSGINRFDDWTSHDTMQVAGAETLMFMRFDDRTDIQAVAKGVTFREVIRDDGPLAAAGRLSLKIKRHFEFGKRRRLFRTKQRSILAGR